MNRSVVSIEHVHHLLQQVRERELDEKQLLKSVQIDPETLKQFTAFSADKFNQLYQAIMALSQDEFFGLLGDGKVPKGTFRMLCHSLIDCTNLEQAIYRASDFHEICRGVQVKPVLARKGRYAKLSFTETSCASQTLQQILEQSSPLQIRTSLSLWYRFLCWLCGNRIRLKAAYFSFNQPEDWHYYQVLFQSDIRFQQHENAIVFPVVYLTYPLVQTAESLRRFLQSAPYQLMISLPDSSLKSQVIAIIGNDFTQPLPDAEQVAERLHISVSTLRRKLLDEGCSYQQVKDDCRMRAAINYMNSPQLSINDVAALMGFNESSSFFRSFKKWTGLTPGEYRQQRAAEC